MTAPFVRTGDQALAHVLAAGLLAVLVWPVRATAQGVAPIVTPTGRFVLFDQGRFHDLATEAPRDLVVAEDKLAYVTPAGELKLVQNGSAHTMEPAPPDQLRAAGRTIAYTFGGVLKLAEPTRPRELSGAAGRYIVRDSLVLFHDRTDATVNVHWKGRSFPLAGLPDTLDVPEAWVGSNTAVLFDRAARTAYRFHRGVVEPLVDSTDAVQVAAGGDLIGFSEDRSRSLQLWHQGRITTLEPLVPQAMQAGDGLLAYVSGGGTFKCWSDGRTHALLDHAPTAWTVQDSLLVVVDAGALKVLHDGALQVVERYVPEQWAVHGGVLTYLDLNREVRRYAGGERTAVSREAGIARFDVHGDTVVFTGDDGSVKVWWRGEVYERY